MEEDDQHGLRTAGGRKPDIDDVVWPGPVRVRQIGGAGGAAKYGAGVGRHTADAIVER
jgi:hypothetical protein